MTISDTMNDLGTGIMRMSNAFKKHRMTPTIIELSCWEDGQQLKGCLDPAHMPYPAMDDDGRPVMQVSIAGVIVRWPAKRKAIGHGYEYI